MNGQEYMFCTALCHQKDYADLPRNQGINTNSVSEENNTVALRRAVGREFMVANCHPVLKVNFVWTVKIPQFAL